MVTIRLKSTAVAFVLLFAPNRLVDMSAPSTSLGSKLLRGIYHLAPWGLSCLGMKTHSEAMVGP